MCLERYALLYCGVRAIGGLNKGQKKEIYFCNKVKIFSFFSAYTDACTSSCKIVVASKRPLISESCDYDLSEKNT